MTERRNKPELLSPAGDFERLRMAVLYGADAVYLAGTSFGMRAFAGNFDRKGLEEAVDAYFRRISKLVQVTMPDGSLATNADGECVWRLVYFVPPSITALCLELEIDRRTWANYAADKTKGPVVERARARIEAYLQEQLLTREKGVQGVIFNLTANYGWRDRKELALSEETRKSLEKRREPMTMEEKLALLQEAEAIVRDHGAEE